MSGTPALPGQCNSHYHSAYLVQRSGCSHLLRMTFLMLSGAYLLALVVDYVSGLSSQFAMSVLGQRSMRTLRNDLFKHMQKLPQSYFDVNPIGRTLTRLTNDVESLAEIFATGAVTIIADLITITAIIGAMLYLDPGMTLYAFVVVPPLILVTIIVQRFAREAFRAVRKHLSRINTFLSEHLPGMTVVQAFAQEARAISAFDELNIAYRNANHKAIRLDASLFSIVEAMGTAAVAVLVWNGAEDLASGTVQAGVLVAFIQYIRRFFIPIRDLSAKYTILQSAFAGAERVFKLLDEPITLSTRENAQSVAPMRDGIEFKAVDFAYKDGENGPDWVLKDIDLKVKPGEKVALVGPTGSGKTTILKLLNRLYDVQNGSITYDGVDLKDLDLQALRRRFAVVLQDVYLFSGTIRDNLKLAADVSEEKIQEAARLFRLRISLTSYQRVMIRRLKSWVPTFPPENGSFSLLLGLWFWILIFLFSTRPPAMSTPRRKQDFSTLWMFFWKGARP